MNPATMSLQATVYHDSDADDEFTHPATDSEVDHSDSEALSEEHTPTSFANKLSDDVRAPGTIIIEWSAEECARFLAALGLRQYCDTFLENEIVGEALIALKHDELKEMGIASVGHRLTILKSVYETKVKQDVPLDPDHYIPLSADQSLNENATQEDIARLIQSIRLRDEKIVSVESDLRRVAEEYRRLREDLLPVFKMAKDRSQPLPPGGMDNHHHDSQPLASPGLPFERPGTGISRTFSKRVYTGGTTPKNNSPTHIPPSILEGRAYDSSALDPSSAAATHLTMNGQLSPGIPSPTSPGAHYSTLASRAYKPNGRSGHDHPEDTPIPPPSRSDRLNPTPVSSRDTPSRSESRSGHDPPSVEIFKSFRVSMDDPCHKVLPAALRKYNIQADWRQYALYIVYGDQERCLGLEERPLILFKQLEKEGRKPMFMLRKQLNPIDNSAVPGGSAPNSAGFESKQAQINLPGGVL